MDGHGNQSDSHEPCDRRATGPLRLRISRGRRHIAASICDGWFNENWFPSYAETYDALQEYCQAAEFLASEDAEEITTKTEYLFKYSNYYTYHPFHAMSMISGGSVPLLWTSGVFLVGPKAPKYARGMGFVPVNTFAEAMERARKIVARTPGSFALRSAFPGASLFTYVLSNRAEECANG